MSKTPQAINASLGTLLIDNEETGNSAELVVITNWFDANGDECDEIDAVSCVAGPTSDGKWLSVYLEDFESVSVH